MADYQIKPGKLGNQVIGAYKKIEEKFVNRFLEEDETSESGYRLKTGKAAEKVTGAYQKIEDTVTGAYQKVEDAFVDAFLEERDGEDGK